jgi:two-component system sensor histidine kinase PhcS
VYTFFNEQARFMLFRLKAEVADKNAELEAINGSGRHQGQMLQQEKMAAIGTLAAGLLHEVNNPVNFCLMAIEVAMEEPAAKTETSMQECLVDAKQGCSASSISSRT